MNLSKRLQAIADAVPVGLTVGDIGTDHGLLPCYLVSQGICPRVIAADINALPLAGAQKNIADYGLTAQIETRLGDGLAVLQADEVEVVTISGMGGSLMVDMLNQSLAVVHQLQRLILQPNVAANQLRMWALENGWQIVDEDLVLEDGRYYEIVVLEPGRVCPLTIVEILVGPILLAKKHPLLLDYLQREWVGDQKVLTKLGNSHSEEARAKEDQLRGKWRAIEEVITCQFKVASDVTSWSK